jgi:zinc D-Ala-D-Ala carboxypeptidase
MNLSKNFTLAEMTYSQMAKDCNIDNTPDELATENLKLLCKHILQPIRDHYGKPVKVNSGYRSAEVNSLVRGSSVSDHVFGCAADIEIQGITNVDWPIG